MRNKYELDHYKDDLYYPKVKFWWQGKWQYMRKMSPKTTWLQKDKNLLIPETYEDCLGMINRYKASLFSFQKKVFGVILIIIFSYAACLGMAQTEYIGQENKYLFSFYVMLAIWVLFGAVLLFSRLIEWCFTE